MNEVRTEVAPFWFWNDKLSKEKLLSQLEGIQAKGIDEVTIHARYGLPVNDYLSDQWFYCFGAVLDKAKQLGMGIWIYDDYNWPSGRAGGLVTKNPDFVAKTCRVDRKGRLVIQQADFEPAYTHEPYVDVLSKDATDTFLALTHEQYFRRFPEFFGSVIKGFFTDEPNMPANFMGILNKGSIPYTEELEEAFRKMHGFNFRDHASSIWRDADSFSVRGARLRYFETVSLLYRNNFLGRIHDWCREHNVLLTGHLLVEEDPLELIKLQADPFAALKEFDIPGFDIIGGFSPERQILAAKLARSVADTSSKIGVMAETFGAFGNGLTTDVMGEIVDWEVRKGGVTMFVPHAIFYSDEEDRRFDYPPVLNSETYWSAMPTIANRFRKTPRQTTHPIDAVYFPTRAIQAEYNPSNPHEASYISRAVQKKVGDLARNGIDFDLLDDEGVLRRLPSFGRLHIPAAEVMPLPTLVEISRFGQAGGTIVFLGDRPQFATKGPDQEKFDMVMQHLLEHGRVEDGDFPNLRRNKNIWNIIDREVKGWDYRHFHDLALKSPRKAQKYTERKGQLSRAWGKIERRFAR